MIKKIYYDIMEKLLKKTNGDYMLFRIKKYRLSGAQIGEKVRAFSPISSREPYLITICDRVTISCGVRFLTHDNSISKVISDSTDVVGSIYIGANSFIGANSIILPGVTIGENCIIGAGSVVTKSFLSKGSVIAGNPAKMIGFVDKLKTKYQESIFDFSNANENERRSLVLSNEQKWIRRKPANVVR